MSQFSYFPMPYDDELVYSWVARYHVGVGNADAMATRKRLFGTLTLSTTLPGISRRSPPSCQRASPWMT